MTHDHVLEPQRLRHVGEPDSGMRLAAFDGRTSGIEDLKAVGRFVQRNMGVAEHDRVGTREGSAKPREAPRFGSYIVDESLS